MNERVYLLADFGGKELRLLAHRARTFANDGEWAAMIEVHSPRSRFAKCDPTKANDPTFWGACRRAAEARAWYIVEAESAEVARKVIAAPRGPVAETAPVYSVAENHAEEALRTGLIPTGSPYLGRIIASGGAK